MLQRVQTLFLLGIIICMGVFVTLPIWGKIKADNTEKMTLDAFYYKVYQQSEVDDNWKLVKSKYTLYIGIAAILAGLVTLYSVFRYDNRLLQMKLSALIALLIMGSVIASVVVILQHEANFDPNVKGNYEIGFFLPVVALLFNSLANRFIKKDEKLVRSVDRIR